MFFILWDEKIMFTVSNLWDFLLFFCSCSSRDVRPSVMLCNLLMLLTNFIALFCTASISSCIEAASAGSHRTSACLGIGWHRSLTGWGALFKAYLMHPRTFLHCWLAASYVFVKLEVWLHYYTETHSLEGNHLSCMKAAHFLCCWTLSLHVWRCWRASCLC